MNNQLLELSKNIKYDADELLKESNLVEISREYGRVEISGSYSLDLMLTPDIDIYILVKKPEKQLALNLLNKLIQESYFNGYLFYDWVKFRKPEFPESYYIGLKTKFNSKKWKIDIWFRDESYIKDPFMDKVRNASDEQKLAIITFKDYRDKYLNDKVQSYTIYEAVVKRNIITIDEFLKYIENKQG